MRITAIYGQSHKQVTWHLAQELVGLIGQQHAGEVELYEITLPNDLPDYCIGCGACVERSEELCPHHEKVAPLWDKIIAADALLFACPVYVYHVTGPMKTFLDHFGWAWMRHRPVPELFRKQAVVLTAAAGRGTRSTVQDIVDSLHWWGVPQIHTVQAIVHAMRWSDVGVRERDRASKDLARVAREVESTWKRGYRADAESVTPSLDNRYRYAISQRIVALPSQSQVDKDYWHDHGYDADKRPWA